MIIGVSSKYDFGRWFHRAVSFETAEVAEKWLHTEEHDFRERELFDELRPAVELAGAEEITIVSSALAVTASENIMARASSRDRSFLLFICLPPFVIQAKLA